MYLIRGKFVVLFKIYGFLEDNLNNLGIWEELSDCYEYLRFLYRVVRY